MTESPAKFIDHTLLRADATEAEIAGICEDAVEFGFASVCIPPCHVTQAAGLLYGSGVAVGTVVGFPLGYQTTETKVFETQRALAQGPAEIDMVIRLGLARAGNFSAVQEDIQKVVAAAASALVKVIIDCCLFDDAAKLRLAAITSAAGAQYVKTSTGFASSGATVEDVRLLHGALSGGTRVKAAGGIRDWLTCRAMLAAGANRIGTSAGPAILRQWLESEGRAQ